ncbi:hypothetical protein SAMN04488542_110111 [Fontibacillus panacisegetis]|uniref:Uncharacterized protein n=1 Tax=Fontibacillus panacisegetis TaxID=670482 RepID=A0A1G7KXS4_9BACL|nr:hypothetical protein SAMN04488542_110111 [Fontibacillus panacisegetis]
MTCCTAKYRLLIQRLILKEQSSLIASIHVLGLQKYARSLA